MDPTTEPENANAEAPLPEVPDAGIPQKGRTRIIAVANQKGGVGKTTTVINLSACLAELGRTVLVVDIDPQGNATSGLGLTQQKGVSLYQALLGNDTIHEIVYETILDRVHVIPSELDLAGAEIDVARMDGYLHCCCKALAPALEADMYDYIIVDCPPALGVLTMNALTAAHSILVPMQCEYYALEGLNVITGIVGKLRASGVNPRLELEGILMTMFDSRTRLAEQVVQEVRKHFPDKIYNTIIPRNVRLSEAPSHGQPVICYDRQSAGAKAYCAFAKEFAERAESAHH